ncbi:MAG: MAPEG family protein, partial [Cyanobacteria bacterium J06623_5]
ISLWLSNAGSITTFSVDILYSLPFVSPNNILLCSIVAAAALIYFPYLMVAAGRFQVGYEMGAPRGMFDKLPEYAQRATWAHQNSWESFALYAPAALMAFVVAVPAEQVLGTAVVYLVSRVGYSLFYVLDVPILRSLSWAVSISSIVSLFVASCQSALV